MARILFLTIIRSYDIIKLNMRLTNMRLKDLIKEAELGYYPNVGHESPNGVKKAIEEWNKESNELKENTPLLYWLLGSGTPEYKMPKDLAKYESKSEISEQMCSNCEYIYLKIANKKYICSQIRGEISPKGWCKLWKKG